MHDPCLTHFELPMPHTRVQALIPPPRAAAAVLLLHHPPQWKLKQCRLAVAFGKHDVHSS